MSFYYYNTTKLAKILLILSFFTFFGESCSVINKIKEKRATKNEIEEAGDPISESVRKEKQKQNLLGIKLTKKDYKKLERIYKKYSLSDKEKELRKRQGGFNESSENEIIIHEKQKNGYRPTTIVKRDEKLNKEPKQNKKRRRLINKFLLGKSYRKDYLRKKKLEEFKKEKILSMQSPKTRARMKENEKKRKQKEKYIKRKKRKRYIKNLFK